LTDQRNEVNEMATNADQRRANHHHPMKRGPRDNRLARLTIGGSMRSRTRQCSGLIANWGGKARPQARHSSMAPALSIASRPKQSQLLVASATRPSSSASPAARSAVVASVQRPKA